ncbi:MAG: DUF4091 domain-containing protein [Clostridium sp.]|nr:DUF4091 domain-containing protein [Clostridium sp.]
MKTQWMNAALIGICLSTATLAQEQQGVTQCGVPTGQPPFPLNEYTELPLLNQPQPEDWKGIKRTQAAWGNTDTRYEATLPPQHTTSRMQLKAWRGERVSAQAVVWSGCDTEGITYELTAATDGKGHTLPAEAFESGFVRYVMADGIIPNSSNCGHRDHTQGDSLRMADCIDPLLKTLPLKARNAQGLWVSCNVPVDAAAGRYRSRLVVRDGGRKVASLPLEIEVSHHTLPAPHDWSYHLDLWQNPFAVARYYQVPLWSDAHFEAMRPIMQRLANAGQKTVTASIMHHPWNAQTEDAFETMVTWMRRADGTWTFDFTVFDRWVEFMFGLGIDRQISCYSMVPWKLSFQYFDQATNSLQFIQTAPGEAAYEEMWTAMLKAFSAHLRQKGWFSRCVIAMDERPMEAMRRTIRVIRKADPEFKISLAGNYHAEIEADLYDYSITLNARWPEGVVERRRANGQISTLYNCCTEGYPNVFTVSPPAEATWLGYYMAARGMDGFLRWTFIGWTREPLLDSRFRTWTAGDTYIVYPGNRTSIRMERLIEGIQAFEKIRILRTEAESKNDTATLRRLDEMLQSFCLQNFPEKDAAETVNHARQVLENL